MELADALQDIITKFAKHLEIKGVDYVFFGSPTGDKLLRGDLDVYSPNEPRFDEAVKTFCQHYQLLLVGKTFHATGVRYDIAFKLEGATYIFPGPDLLKYPTWKVKGKLNVDFTSVIKHRERSPNGYFEPNNHSAFLFYLIKKIDKKAISKLEFDYLVSLYNAQERNIDSALQQLWKAKGSDVALCFKQKDMVGFESISEALFEELASQQSFDFERLFYNIKRIAFRLSKRTGLHVVFMGPDGSGKSTIISLSTPLLKNSFRGVEYIHFRPNLANKSSQSGYSVVSDPHKSKARGYLGSLMKLCYLVGDYFIGYLVKVLPLLVKSRLVMFDRYYQDLMVDPIRYRHKGPNWCLTLLGKIVPNPDLFILMDAPAEVLQERKQEVSIEESRRQRDAYLELFEQLPNAYVVDTSKNIDDAVNETVGILVNYMSRRLTTRNESKLSYGQKN
ncbi:hypothetical protein [Thalassotalea euphylliae]|uniref:Thymidylate kinase-like domain-containing protein n=1 Tax=Thalassotalea euphylliae TaxID=1655234 RepID=A0A3E0UJ14_9GAMM|nr:hypothetical protein [Thalassotalea euphylliae]REL36564.1 hypothetical protein DXX92_15265 [Thalassotalea euphylliae]